jgi:hypothetical protein
MRGTGRDGRTGKAGTAFNGVASDALVVRGIAQWRKKH